MMARFAGMLPRKEEILKLPWQMMTDSPLPYPVPRKEEFLKIPWQVWYSNGERIRDDY